MCIFVTNGILEAVQEFLSTQAELNLFKFYLFTNNLSPFLLLLLLFLLIKYFLVLAVIFPFQNEPYTKPSHLFPLGHSGGVPSQKRFFYWLTELHPTYINLIIPFMETSD